MSSTLSAQQPGAVDPGYTTTEFWQTLIVQALSIAVVAASLAGTNLKLDGVQAVVPSVAVVAAAIAQAFYSHSRAQVKAAAQAASSQAAAAGVTVQGAPPPVGDARPRSAEVVGASPSGATVA